VDRRTDVYALGVLLYTTLVGVAPSAGMVVSPRANRSDIPEGVERVIFKAMAQNPDQRFNLPPNSIMLFKWHSSHHHKHPNLFMCLHLSHKCRRFHKPSQLVVRKGEQLDRDNSWGDCRHAFVHWSDFGLPEVYPKPKRCHGCAYPAE